MEKILIASTDTMSIDDLDSTMDHILWEIESDLGERYANFKINYTIERYDFYKGLALLESRYTTISLHEWFAKAIIAMRYNIERVTVYFEGGKLVIEKEMPEKHTIYEITALKQSERIHTPIKISGRRYI